MSTLPDEAESKQAFLTLESEFSGGAGSPVEIVIDGVITPSVTASIDAMQAALAADPSFGPSTVEVNDAGDLALISAPLSGDIAGNDALDAIRELRAELVPEVFGDVPVEVLVGGDAAYNLDYLDQTALYTPIVFSTPTGRRRRLGCGPARPGSGCCRPRNGRSRHRAVVARPAAVRLSLKGPRADAW